MLDTLRDIAAVIGLFVLLGLLYGAVVALLYVARWAGLT